MMESLLKRLEDPLLQGWKKIPVLREIQSGVEKLTDSIKDDIEVNPCFTYNA